MIKKTDCKRLKKRYYPFSDFLQKKFGEAVYKISLNAGVSCPNRDGTKGINGCAFCNNEAFSPAIAYQNLSIQKQLETGIERFQRKRKKIKKFIAYFQSFSNTYAPSEKLEKLYESALEIPDIAGIAVGTRPDCLEDDKLEVIKTLAQKTHFWLEIGLETSFNQTLSKINRGHTYEEFLESYEKARKIKNLFICIHLIHGLPGESKEMMLDTVRKINQLKPDAVKFHQLEIVRGTLFEKWYQEKKITLLSIDQYMDVLADSLALLSPDIVIQRLFGFTPSSFLIAPELDLKESSLSLFEKYLEEKQIYQGVYHENKKVF
ncbi:MAG TPA: TIGR01212 family radical SAM protein [Spirochaetia bacterium]|nr:TIGR01212 family radical SAM protein [Spirochaetia bacterium]